MSALVAINRVDVANYVDALFLVYIGLIFVRVLLSWLEAIGRVPFAATLRPLLDFVHQTTDPYLNLFRRILPPLGGRGFALDLSPVVAIIVLLVLRAVVVGAIDPG
jgi:YggT family protein